MATPTIDSNAKTLDQLRSFCRGEMSAVESYTAAMLDASSAPFVATLRACRESHRTRARLLADAIAKMGGKPPQSSGAWGALTEVIEGTAQVFGAKAILTALTEGEDHGVRDYVSDLAKLSAPIRRLVQREIIPAQYETRRAIGALRESLGH